MKKSLQQQKRDAEAKFNARNDICKADMTNLQMSINTANNQVNKYSKLIEMDAPVLADRQTELGNKEAELETRVTHKKKLEADRAVEIEVFEATVAEVNTVRNMLHQARQIIENAFQTEGEFLQTSMFSRLSSTLRSFEPKPQGLSHGYAAIFNVLAKIAERAPQQADQSMIDNIMRIFDDIEENLDNALSLERFAEKEREKTYDVLFKRISTEIGKLNAKIADLKRLINQLTLTIDQNQDNLDEQAASATDNGIRLADRAAECSEEDRIFQAFSNNL